jgi:hypothetical protein
MATDKISRNSRALIRKIFNNPPPFGLISVFLEDLKCRMGFRKDLDPGCLNVFASF